MNITMIDRDMALDLIEQACARRGAGFTYYAARLDEAYGGGCQYLRRNIPAADEWAWSHITDGGACLLGFILVDILGIPESEIEGHEGQSIGMIFGSNGITVGDTRYVLSDQADAIFNAAQSKQDDGATWGEALAYANRSRFGGGA